MLPPLTGTEKQIQWASDIRNDFFGANDPVTGNKSAANWIKLIIDQQQTPKEKYEAILLGIVESFIKSQSDSSWWIENRRDFDRNNFKFSWKKFATDDDVKAALVQSGYIPKRGKLLRLYNEISI